MESRGEEEIGKGGGDDVIGESGEGKGDRESGEEGRKGAKKREEIGRKEEKVKRGI